MEKAVMRFRKAIANNETIGVFADSDLDGLTSLTALTTLIKRLAPDLTVHHRYPRGSEYYGLTKEVVDEFHERNATLLITLDCGTKDVAEIALAAEKGIDVIVIDHHEADGVLPETLIVNPKRKDCKYPFKELAGVGVVFKFCHAVLMSYLPGFSKKILIVSGSNGIIEAALVVNGIIERMGKCENKEELRALVQSVDFVMAYRCADAFFKNGIFDGIPYVDIAEELPSFQNDVPKFGASNFSQRTTRDGIDAAVRAFLELQYRKSPKIMEFNTYILGLVALGSIADIVPLVGENRVLVHMGLEALKQTAHDGLALLLENKKVSSKTLGWHVAPILNAPGRMGKTDYTANFLLGGNGQEKKDILDEIVGLNNKRKEIVEEECSRIHALIENGAIDSSGQFLFVKADLPEGLIGLIANRISDAMKKPVVVVSRPDEHGLVKGSGRVRGEFDFFSKIASLTPLFDKIGGHAQAFGFTIREEFLEEAIAKISASLSEDPFQSAGDPVDCVLDICSVTLPLAESLALLEPTGKGNEEPVFLTKGAVVRKCVRMGVDNRHGKYFFRDNAEAEAVGWHLGERMEQCARAGAVDMVYRLEVASYNGRTYPLMVLLDINPG
jgi:single-stranded-DNA-specific exonuclease